MELYRLDITTVISVTQEDVDDIMCAALEGGITHWCNKVEVIGDCLGKYAHEQIGREGSLMLHVRGEHMSHALTPYSFRRGLHQFIQDRYSNCAFICGNKLDASMLDAGDADCIVQYALFGELVYS